MNEKIIEISKRGVSLNISNGMLLLKDNDLKFTLPLEDLAAVILTERAISLTGAVLSELANNNISVIICDRKYSPCGTIMPMNNVSVHNILLKQIAMKKTLQKQLWKAIISQKILNQSAVLKQVIDDDANIANLAYKVMSGDKTIMDAIGSKKFWKALPFIKKRDRNQKDINILLNYSYMVVYSLVARSLCGAGLNPNIGFSHHNKYNPFCLASDIIEPYRFLPELAVFKLCNVFKGDFSSDMKKSLLDNIFHTKFRINAKREKLMEGIKVTVSSLKSSIVSGTVNLKFPQPLEKY
jgi:CRISPR-associated protein Cas1